jgi:hypothetical protein
MEEKKGREDEEDLCPRSDSLETAWIAEITNQNLNLIQVHTRRGGNLGPQLSQLYLASSCLS